MINAVIADDQSVVRTGLRTLLEEQPDIRVVAEAANGAEAVAAVVRHIPDVALVDIRMPVLDGISVTRQIVARHPETRVIMLTTFDLDEYVFAALRAGAAGFLLKDVTAEDLVESVRNVASGRDVLAANVTRRVIEAFAATPEPDESVAAKLHALSPRERDILTEVAAGRSNAEIARRLHLGESTVKTHVSNLLTKLGARDRLMATILAYEGGLIRTGQGLQARQSKRGI